MKLKTLVATVAVLAVLSVVVFFVNRPKAAPSDDPRVGRPLVDQSAVEKASKVVVSDQGKSVTLAKDSQGSWRVSSYYDFPADFRKLSSLVSDLTAAKVEQFVSGRPERLSRLEFRDTKIELSEGEKALVTLTLGKNADAGGRFVRFGSEEKGYRANLNTWLDAEAKNWADSTLVPVKPEDVAHVELSFSDGPTVVASRAKKEDTFTTDTAPQGQRLKADKLTSTLASLSGLKFSETTDLTDPNAAAAKEHQRSFKLTTFDGKTVTIALGRKPEQKIVKPPAPKADGTTGPGALGSITDSAGKADEKAAAPAKLAEPETETLPAGPVFATVSHSEAAAPINAVMAKRAFQINEWSFTGLPQKREGLFEPVPTPPPAPTPPSSTQEAPKSP